MMSFTQNFIFSVTPDKNKRPSMSASGIQLFFNRLDKYTIAVQCVKKLRLFVLFFIPLKVRLLYLFAKFAFISIFILMMIELFVQKILSC